MKLSHALIASVLSLTSVTALAGSLEVTPVRINFDAHTPIGSVTLRNTGSDPMVVQTELMQWSGRDVYAPSRALLVNPTVFTLAPGAAQIVRVGLNAHRPAASKELAYRLYFQEIPQPVSGQQGSGLRIALKVGVPVFVASEKSESRLGWTVERVKNGDLRVRLANRGNVHVQILDLKLAASETEGSDTATKDVHEYVLAGEKSEWLVHPAKPWTGDSVVLSAHTDGEASARTVKLEK